MIKIKKVLIGILAVFVTVSLLRVILPYFEKREAEFPEETVFDFEVIGDEVIELGNKAYIDVYLRLDVRGQYKINYNRLFRMSVKDMFPEDTFSRGVTYTTLEPGRTLDQSFEFIPEKSGDYEITLAAVFSVEKENGETRDYRLEKIIKLKVTE